MKGIAIYEIPFMGMEYVRAVDIRNADYTFEASTLEDASVSLSGYFSKSSQAKRSKNDTYDFEIGALIALMKMCGKEKTEKAYLETFFKGGDPGDCPYYQICKEPTIKRLEEENERLCEKIERFDRMLRICRDNNKSLTAENEKLKLDCEKLKKGYSAGLGRLVNINGVNYRECDEKGRVVWMTSQPESFSFFANYIDTDALEALRVSKREKMWDDILKEGRTPVYVKREDIHDFLEECQVVGIKWSSGKMPLETMPFHMSEGYAGVYFFIMTSLDISKTKRGAKEFRHVMSWWCTADPAEVEAAIHYIRPMRWDLFEKGRIVVKVNKENHSEFCSRVFSHFTKVGISSFNRACKFGYLAFNKDTQYVESVLSSDCDDIKEINRRKVVDWEDVR